MDIITAKQIMSDAQTVNPVINAADIFANVHGMTMASICYVTEVATAANSPLKGKIAKVTKASVSLANNLKEYTNVFVNKVKRTAEEPVTDWQPTETYFRHTDTFCVTEHKKDPSRHYLFSLYNGAEVVYVNLMTGAEMTRDEVAREMTPSAAKKLLDDSSEVYNKKNDVTHKAIVRTVSLDNLASLTVQGTKYVGKFTYSE